MDVLEGGHRCVQGPPLGLSYSDGWWGGWRERRYGRRGHGVVCSEAVRCWLEVCVEGGLNDGELVMLVDLLLAFVLIIGDKLFYFLGFLVVFHVHPLYLELLQPLLSVEMGQRAPGALGPVAHGDYVDLPYAHFGPSAVDSSSAAACYGQV